MAVLNFSLLHSSHPESRSCVQVANSAVQSVCSFFGDREDKRETAEEEAVRCDY